MGINCTLRDIENGMMLYSLFTQLNIQFIIWVIFGQIASYFEDNQARYREQRPSLMLTSAKEIDK